MGCERFANSATRLQQRMLAVPKKGECFSAGTFVHNRHSICSFNSKLMQSLEHGGIL